MLEILKSVFWVGSATLFNLLVWVVAGKVLAVMLGPAGIGMYGLLRQLAQNLNVVATFNGSTTLVQGLASRPEDQRPTYARNVAMIFLGLGMATGLSVLMGAHWLAPRLLGREVPSGVLAWMVLPIVGMSLSSFFLGMLNGYRHLKALVVCQAVGPVAALALIYPVALWIRGGGIWAYGLILGVPYILIGLAAALVVFQRGWFIQQRPAKAVGLFNKDSRHFFGLSSALLIGGAATTGLQLFINGMVARRLGMAELGQFWVAWSLSMTYVTVLLGSFSAYYLPTLSGAKDAEAKRTLILSFTRIVILVMPVLVTLVIVCKGELVRLLFSPDLLPSLKVFRWMLMGDFLKVLSWVWAFPMLAYAEGKTFLVFEVVTNLVWGLLAWIGFQVFPSIETMGQLFLGVYLLYSVATMIYLGRVHHIRLPMPHLRGIFAGLGVIFWASFLFWNRQGMPLIWALAAVGPAMLSLWVALSASERRLISDWIANSLAGRGADVK